MMRYVTYDEAGNLTGCYLQELRPDHAAAHIEVTEDEARDWLKHRAVESEIPIGEDEEGPIMATVWVLDLKPEPEYDLAGAKVKLNAAINEWRARINFTTFPHDGKVIACDALSRSDIDAVAGHISLFGDFPVDFPGAWKAVDNTYVVLADVDAFKAMYASMTAQGTANFVQSQVWKAQMAAAADADDIAAVYAAMEAA